MKKNGIRVALALVLALVMLVTLATPALARPLRGDLVPLNEPIGTGKYVLQVTHDNHLKVTVTLSGAETNDEYFVYLYSQTNPDYPPVYSGFLGVLETNGRGNGRLSWVSPTNFTLGDWDFDVRVALDAVYEFHSDYDLITFE